MTAVVLVCAAIAVPLFFAFGGMNLVHGSANVGQAASAGCDTDMFSCNAVPKDEPGDDAGKMISYWDARTTYPTGKYNPLWLRAAAAEAKKIPVAIPAGHLGKFTQIGTSRNSASGPSTFSPNPPSAVALGPAPENMNGCSGCYNYGRTEGRVNAIVVDPTTTTNGSIVAYLASDGGGVWKTTNCCSATTTWTITTDNPLISDISIDALTIDPNNHNTIYAGTGDLNFGSFSMGSQGILKSTDGGATWTVLGSSVFGPAYTEPAGQYPQYDAVGKVAVDPNNSNNVVAGTKKGLFFSYDGGNNWTGPCLTNSFTTMRQDTTGLVLTDMGGGVTRILAAVGTRGFNSPVQYDLNNNGANGIYKATMAASGCPSFTPITTDTNGFVFGTAVTGSPEGTGAQMHADSGTAYVSTSSTSTVGDQLGRIDIGVAPSNPNVIYAQVGSIAANSGSGCGSAAGCQLGAWASTDGGNTWTFMAGSAGGSLRACGSSGSSNSTTNNDYPQNWYDQGVAVDPNNADRVFFDTFEVWMATRTGTTWYDTTCAYTQTGLGMHADEHALAFLPGNSGTLLAGNDGGVDGTLNASSAVLNTTRPTWFNMDLGLNTIEFYSADIWGGAASNSFQSPGAGVTPWAVGGAQDNMDSTVHFTAGSTPSGPVQWQGNVGGDGFWSAIDGKGGYFYVGNNGPGDIHRCTSSCDGTGAKYGSDITNSTLRADTQSFVLPFDLFRGNIGGTGNAECGTRCNHMLVGTTRVWEDTSVDTASFATTSVRTPSLVKGTLGNRSYINQLHYAPGNQTLAIVATNDGNIQFLYGLGGAAGTTPNVNLTASNAVLPNRPMLDARIDPTSQNTVANPVIGYAAVGGFNANTPTTPGHVFRVVCDVNCANFTWQDKTGNLPDIPVDSIQPNPNFPQQVFVGTDFGLYFTNDITAASPTWFRFQNGLPNVMIWDLQVDRGNSSMAIATRSRGAYAWQLPTGAIKTAQTITFGALADKTYGDPDFDVSATSDSGLPVTFTASGGCTVAGTTVHITSGATCTVTAQQAGNLDYAAATDVPQTFIIANTPQSISFAGIADHTMGDADFPAGASASSGLDISYSTNASCSVTDGTVHLLHIGTCTITASQPGNASYAAASDVQQSFSIAKGGQTISFSTTDKTFGDADFNITATSSSGLTVSLAKISGPCTIDSTTSPANVHISGTGTCSITASQAGNDDFFAADDVNRTFNINKASQSISFASLPDKTWGDSAITLSASSSSGNTVTFAVQDDCSLDADAVTLHITGAGSCTVTASQAGDSNYNPAPDVQHTFTINKASQTITFDPLTDKTYGDPDFDISATSDKGLLVSFSIKSGQCALIGGQVHITGAGSCTVTASQAGDSNYNAAPDVDRTFTINKADQSITFGSLADKTYGAPDFPVSGTSSSGLPVTFTTSGDCQLVYGEVDITGAGSCTVTAHQTGTSNYNAATDVPQTFSIAMADQSITFAQLNDATQQTPDVEIDASASSGLTVSLSASGPCTLSASVSPASVHITGAGTCSITATQGGNTNYNGASDVTRSFSISKNNQSITFALPADRTWGDPDFDPAATASSGLAVTYHTSGNCSIVSPKEYIHILGAGSCTVTASQVGDTNNNPASDVQRTFSIAQADQAIAIGTHAPSSAVYGTSFTVAATGGGSGNAVVYGSSGGCSNTGATFTMTSGTTACVVSYSQAGNSNYKSSPILFDHVVGKPASQAITVTTHAPSKAIFGTSFTVVASSNSGLAVTYSSSGACSNSGATFTITRAGTCTVTYSQPGDSNYSLAPAKVESVTVKSSKLRTGTTLNCNGTYSGTGLAVIVPAGSTCGLLPGTHVSNSITVKRGGTLYMIGGKIGGTLSAGGDVTVCGTKIGHDVKAGGGSVTLGGPGCAGNLVHGDVFVTNDSDDVWVWGNTIHGQLSVDRATGDTTSIDDNHVGDLSVTNSGPPVDVSGNHAVNATCSNNKGQTGSGNSYTAKKGKSGCPK
jgi:hypothetical protein